MKRGLQGGMASGQDAHSMAVNDGIFVKVSELNGRAPDLGALEYGKPAPHYGPRP